MTGLAATTGCLIRHESLFLEPCLVGSGGPGRGRPFPRRAGPVRPSSLARSSRPHGPRVRVRDPEDGPAQPRGPAGGRPRPRGLPGLGSHGRAVPAGDRGAAQYPAAAEPAGPGVPSGWGGLRRGRADAALPGRVRRLPGHVPAHPGDSRC